MSNLTSICWWFENGIGMQGEHPYCLFVEDKFLPVLGSTLLHLLGITCCTVCYDCTDQLLASNINDVSPSVETFVSSLWDWVNMYLFEMFENNKAQVTTQVHCWRKQTNIWVSLWCLSSRHDVPRHLHWKFQQNMMTRKQTTQVSQSLIPPFIFVKATFKNSICQLLKKLQTNAWCKRVDIWRQNRWNLSENLLFFRTRVILFARENPTSLFFISIEWESARSQ